MGSAAISCDPCDARGTVAAIVCLSLTVILWCGAFAVDVGSLYADRRRAQGAADLAAMAAAADLARAEDAARATLLDNGVGSMSAFELVTGRYRADAELGPAARFAEGAGPANAVRLRIQRDAPLYLAAPLIGVESWTVGVEATAVATRQAAFSVGSRLARLEGGTPNALLGALLGGDVTLDVMDYEALIDADVKLFAFMKALATELRIEAGTFDDVLAADATMGDVLDALAAVTGDAAAASAIAAVGNAANANVSVPLGAIVDLGPYGGVGLDSSSPGFDPSVNAMGLISAAAAIANGGRQLALNLGAGVPGIASLVVDLAIGEPMQGSAWFTVGEEDATVRTVQTRLRLVATIGGSGLLAGIAVRVPLYLELASAEARLAAIACGSSPGETRVDIAARPALAGLWIGELDPAALSNFARRPQITPARLIRAPLLRVDGEAQAEITNAGETTLSFDRDDIDAGAVKSTATDDALQTLLDGLVRDLDIRVTILGLGLGLPGPVKAAVANLLVTTIPLLDGVIQQVLDALGLSLGEADVRVDGVRCDGAALVG